MDFTHIVSSALDAGAAANATVATYSITYALDPVVSAVSQVQETYIVASGSVTLSVRLLKASSDVHAIFWRAPAFVTDGERNATTATDGQRLTVCLPAPEASPVRDTTTCSHFDALVPAQGSWTPGSLYTSRNGYLQAYESQSVGPGETLSLRVTV